MEAVDTEERGHATEICREAANEGYDVVVAFGGDGTVNEAANGLVGSDTPLTCLPGGSTNVFCRTLGIPNDVVDATEHLLRMADEFEPRARGPRPGERPPLRVRLGRRARRQRGASAWTPIRAARRASGSTTSPTRPSHLQPPLPACTRRACASTADGRTLEAVTVIVQNSDPFTYFGKRPIRVCRGAGLDTGSLGSPCCERATLLEMPTLIPRIFSGRADTLHRHRQVVGLEPVRAAVVSTRDGRPFPVEVDGDYLGEYERVDYGIAPRSLAVVA